MKTTLNTALATVATKFIIGSQHGTQTTATSEKRTLFGFMFDTTPPTAGSAGEHRLPQEHDVFRDLQRLQDSS